MNKQKKQALMVYNPYSGKKKNHSSFELLLEKLLEEGYHVTVQQAMELKDSANVIKNVCANKWDAIFIAGGDGTVNHTLQYMAEQEYRPKVGIFPFGTSNEFAKFIGVPYNLEEAISIIKRGRTKTVDIGKFGDYYFANIAAAGWLTDITYKTSPFLKSYFGEFAYSLCFIKTLLLTKQTGEISIRISPEQELSDLSIFLIMNGNSVGPLERLINTPTHLNGGYFHLLTCRKTNRFQLFLTLLAKILKIKKSVPQIKYSKINSGSFIFPESFLVNLDGEQVEINSMDFKVLPSHLDVFTS